MHTFAYILVVRIQNYSIKSCVNGPVHDTWRKNIHEIRTRY